jgi:hypothetical protein
LRPFNTPENEMTKHTPGPWEVDAHGSPVIYGQSPKGRMRVADIRGWGHLTGGGHGALGLPDDQAIAIQEANGRLIAAAPELLEVAKELKELFRFALLSTSPTIARDGMEFIRKAEAIIAKAEAPSQDAA